jgi:hypothetical protein
MREVGGWGKENRGLRGGSGVWRGGGPMFARGAKQTGYGKEGGAQRLAVPCRWAAFKGL